MRSRKTNTLIDLIITAYGPAAWPAVGFALTTAHSDMLYRHTRCMPHLLLYGPRGSGKSTLLRALAALTGDYHLLHTDGSSNGHVLLTANGLKNNLVVVDGFDQVNTPSITSMLGSLYFRHFPVGVKLDEVITSNWMGSGYAIATNVRPVGATLLERCVVVEMSDMQHDRMAFEALHAQLDTLQHAPVDHADLRSGLRSSGAVLSTWIADVHEAMDGAPEPNRTGLHMAMLMTVLTAYEQDPSKSWVLKACNYVNSQR